MFLCKTKTFVTFHVTCETKTAREVKFNINFVIPMVFEGSFTTRSDWHALDCEQSLFSPSVSHARERASSVKRQRREKGGCVFSRVLFDGLRETARSLSTPGIGHLKGRAGALANHFCSETIYALNCENKTHHKVRIRSRILLE